MARERQKGWTGLDYLADAAGRACPMPVFHGPYPNPYPNLFRARPGEGKRPSERGKRPSKEDKRPSKEALGKRKVGHVDEMVQREMEGLPAKRERRSVRR